MPPWRCFAGTNVDDIVVLTVLFVASSTGGRPRTWQIVTGQYLGFSALVAISVIAALGLSWGSDTTTSSLNYLADLNTFDVPAVAATLAGAPQALAAPDNSQTYLIVEGAEGGGVELSIHSMAAGTGFMQVNPDGSVKKVFPP